MMTMLQDVEGAQEVTLPSGVRYTDLRIGGGQLAARGLLVILDLRLYADDELIHVIAAAMAHYSCPPSDSCLRILCVCLYYVLMLQMSLSSPR